ncbi:MAG: hypothetical protein ABDH61_01370 [Acidilobaceae archaeon]
MKRLLVLLVLALFLVPADGATTLATESTPVHSLDKLALPPHIVYKQAAVSGHHVIMGGEGFVARANIMSSRLEGTVNVVGNVTSLSVDAVPSQWVAAGTNRGEVILLNFRDLSQKAHLYLASRGAVKGVYLARVEGGSRLIAFDDKGFLYVMGTYRGTLSGGWFELGPVQHLGALTGLYDVRITHVFPLVHLRNWTSYQYEGTKVVALSEQFLPETPRVNKFLGGISVEVLYGPQRERAVTGKVDNFTEGRLYYAVIYDNIVVPMGESQNGLLEAQNYTLSLLGLFPQDYRLLLVYEVKRLGGDRKSVTESSCYAGVRPVTVRPADVTHLGEITLNLTGSSLADCLEKVRIGGKRFYQLSRPAKVQAIFLLDTSRLPTLFDFERDLRVILVPITKEMIDSGISSLREHEVAMLVRPGMGRPKDWQDIDSVFVLGVRGWLIIYYLGKGLRLVDVGYQQPQMIYLGDGISALEVSPDLKRIFVGTISGTVYRLLWLSDIVLFKPNERRYFLDSSLKVDVSPIASLAELEGGELLLVTSQAGRIQMVKLVDVWEPLWRSGEDQYGLETGVASIRVVSRAINEIIMLSPTNDIYWFKRPLQDIHTITVKVGVVSFNEDGNWSVTAPSADLSLQALSRGVPVATAVVKEGRATLYLPTGTYDLVFSQGGARSRPLPLAVSKKGELSVVLIPRPDVIVAERAENATLLRQIVEQNKPRVSFELRISDVDGNPVLEPLRALLYSPEIRFLAVSRDGVFRFADVPVGLYTFTIEEPGSKYEPHITSLKVTVQGPDVSTILLQPRKVEVSIRLVDALLRAPALESFRIRLERQELGSPQIPYPKEVTVTRGVGSVQLPLGTYRLTALPLGRNYFPTSAPITFRVEEPTRVEVRVQPREYPVTVKLKNSWGEPVTDARITLARLEGGYFTELRTRGTPAIEALVPYGLYELTASADFYRSARVEVNVPEQQEVEVILEPTLPLLALRYAPYGFLLAITVAGAYVLNVVRRVIEERMRQEYF